MSRLNILTAIPYLNKQTIEFLESKKNIDFLLDSGAFTAWKKGEEFSIDFYLKFIEQLPFKPWRYFTLDKIGDPKGTKLNYEIIKASGYNPIPIFTRGEKLEELEYYYSHSDVVGIGGLVGTRGNKGFVNGIMKKIGSRKCHWLGFTNSDFIYYHKPYSCDSSSWARAVQYASIKLYCGNGKWIALNKNDFKKRPSQEVFKQFEEYGEDIKRMSRESEWHNSGRGDFLLEVITCKSWVRYMLDVEKYIGTKFFLACACFWQVKLMDDAFNYWLTKPQYSELAANTPSDLLVQNL